MGWLDDLQGKQLQQDGTNVPQRKTLNIIGATVEDNPTEGRTDMTIHGLGYAGAKLSVAAQSNSGVSAYPSDSDQAVGTSSFIRTAAADHDSVRMPNESDDIVPILVGMQGRVSNHTSYIIDLYPPVGAQLGVDGAQLGVDTPIEIPPFGSVQWMLDLDGTFYCY